MRNDEWQKVEALLNAALEVEPGARRRFLDEACAGAPGLRREVESLLVCEAGADGFLEAPALALSADFFDGDGPGDRAGQTVGRYRIIREIGRGGMGAVFLAERSDGEFRQEVALKVVRRSFADTELARRFRQERQILASLNHPNIARLLDGGVSSDGEPFLAMEYVEGVRIDEYCEGRRLSTGARLRLFLEVCRGVSYAHQHLVVHRDIKPSNVLVTKEGVPKLLDFGIAKLLDPEQAGEQTRTELRAFTPDYASPEQVSGGRITTASDVYSLGVLLGDLLRGTRHSQEGGDGPGGWRSESPGRKTAPLNPPPDGGREGGRTRTGPPRSAGVELANIIAMARREDPARRYASAGQLAEDVQRYLDGRPVRAQKDSFTYRAGKFVRRNKAGVAAAVVVLLTLVGGIIATVWQARRAETNQARAEKRFADVRGLANALLNDIAPKMERLEGSTEARQALVTQSLKYLDSLAGESADDVTLQAELAAAYEKVGVLQGDSRRPSLSDFRGAIASLEKAQQIRRRLLGVNPGGAENRRLLADNLRLLAISHNLSKSFSRLGISASNLGKPAEALGYLERAMAIVLGLQEKDPLNRGYDRDLSALHIRIGVARARQRDFGGALAAYLKSAELYEKQFAAAANSIALRDMAIAYRLAGGVREDFAETVNRQSRQTHLASAKENYRQALDALLRAQAHKALPEVNRKLIEETRRAIEELDNLR